MGILLFGEHTDRTTGSLPECEITHDVPSIGKHLKYTQTLNRRRPGIGGKGGKRRIGKSPNFLG
jgi:hypothetical protein